jgi:outer membrane protein assembly factor BamA
VSGSISLFNARDRFYQFSTGRRKRLGGSLNFGFPVPGTTRTRVFTGYSIARTKYELFEDTDDQSLFGLPPGTQSTFLFGVVRNTVNHPLFPTLGTRQSWNLEVNGGILGGDGDFTKHMVEGAWWVPVGQLGSGAQGTGPQLALGLTIRSGAIFGDASRFPFDRFFMGGVQFGQQLRGYDETSITPFGFFEERAAGIQEGQRVGDAFLNLTAEYALRVNDNASISAFFDAGNVWIDPSVRADRDRLRLRLRQAGAGLAVPFQDGRRAVAGR